MGAQVLVRDLTWIVYLSIFLSVAWDAAREPRRATIDIALFFGLVAWVIISSVLLDVGLLPPSPLLGAISGTLILALAYVLLRLVDDFTVLPPYVLGLAASLLAVLGGALFVLDAPLPVWLTLLQVLYFGGLQVYAAHAFIRASRFAGGVTRRRMRAVALGSGCLGLTIVAASLEPLHRDWELVSLGFGLLSGICYFLGFATPGFLRRAWQEPELRAFLGRAATLPRLPSTAAIARAIEQGAADALGAPHAAIGLWQPESETLHFEIDGQVLDVPVSRDRPTGLAFLTQTPVFIADVPRMMPAVADMSRVLRSIAVLVAPITAGEQRLGVLSVYASRAPIFARDDLALVQLLAEQAAVIFESRALIDATARMHAREEATRLKDDFLSAAAHDLKTPLTTLVGRAQLLERRALRTPDAPADLGSIRAIVREAERLRTFVLELLDANRAERGQLVGQRDPLDLREVIAETVGRYTGAAHTVVATVDGPVVGDYDRNRISQLLDNLVENAIKYSPEHNGVELTLAHAQGMAYLTVTDHGIGIPAADIAHIFERFSRGTNVDDRRFAGLGLGLYICRGIVEQHGGQIWATSAPGAGTTMHVTLPATPTGVPNA